MFQTYRRQIWMINQPETRVRNLLSEGETAGRRLLEALEASEIRLSNAKTCQKYA